MGMKNVYFMYFFFSAHQSPCFTPESLALSSEPSFTSECPFKAEPPFTSELAFHIRALVHITVCPLHWSLLTSELPFLSPQCPCPTLRSSPQHTWHRAWGGAGHLRMQRDPRLAPGIPWPGSSTILMNYAMWCRISCTMEMHDTSMGQLMQAV